MKDETILNLMITQHAMLESLFFPLKNELKKKMSGTDRHLADFIEELRNHFSIEEGIIFNFLPWRDPQITDIIERLRKEHNVMLEILEKMAKDLQSVSSEEIEEFYKLIISHRETEEEKLYPSLDSQLARGQQQEIIDRIHKKSLI